MSCHRSALILALSVCFCFGCQRETVDTRAQDERAIREADAATLRAAQAKDVDGAVANYAEDGSWLPPHSWRLHRRHPLLALPSVSRHPPLEWHASKGCRRCSRQL